MTRFLLDTSIVSAAMWKVPSQRVLRRLREHGADCALAAPVWHELQYGCQRLPKGRRREALQAYLEDVIRPTMPVVPYEEHAAAWHAAERVRVEAAGKTAPFVDGQIAAIAAVNDLTVVTANVRDFRVFKGVVVVDWTR